MPSPVKEQEKRGMANYLQRRYPAAKESLLGRGKKAELVEKMPVAQVVLLDELHAYDRLLDDLAKLHGLPYWQTAEGRASARKSLRDAQTRTENAKVGGALASLFLSSVEGVIFASVRFDRWVALLRTVEALRLYAAAHDGKLPAKLGDVKEVPVPTDPVTGKPFEYKVEGNKATLTAPAPPGHERGLSRAARYEITLTK
jgi:hypothetical protein